MKAPEVLEARTRRYGFSFERLLDQLRRYIRVYPNNAEEELPTHSVVWVEELGGGAPAQLILDFIKENPNYWIKDLPEEVCVVPREVLKGVTGFDDDYITEVLEFMGHTLVENRAARKSLNRAAKN